tara:strand:- start:13085 stop:14110 length:1026 start_codon:yes stop_codon:yes gene_type:complete
MHNLIFQVKKALCRVAFFVLFPIATMGQNTYIADVEDFLVDMLVISNKYVSPAAEAAVYQSTGSWYSSAKSLDLFEVDVSLHVNALPISNDQKSFTVRDTDFISLKIRDATSAEVPTALGDDTDVFYDFLLNGEAYELQTFEGAKQQVFYYPYLQGSIGLWKQTELTLQYVPEVKIDASGYKTFGGAIKHNLSQYWLGSDTDNTAVQVAVQIAYSLFDSKIFFDDFEISATDPEQPALAVINSLAVDADAVTLQFIASKRYRKFEFVGAFAMSANQFDYTMGGQGDFFLSLLNEAFTALEDTSRMLRGNIGVNYHINNLYLASNITIGRFVNTNFSIHYKL